MLKGKSETTYRSSKSFKFYSPHYSNMFIKNWLNLFSRRMFLLYAYVRKLSSNFDDAHFNSTDWQANNDVEGPELSSHTYVRTYINTGKLKEYNHRKQLAMFLRYCSGKTLAPGKREVAGWKSLVLLYAHFYNFTYPRS